MGSRQVLDALVGVYVSMLVVSTSALVRWEAVAPTFSVERAVVVGLGIGVVVALVVGTVDDLAERVTSWPVMAVAVGPPLLYLRYVILVPEPGSTQALVAGAGLFAVIPGAGVFSVGRRINTHRRRETATEITTVTVGAYDGTALRRWLHVGRSLYTLGSVTLICGFIVFVGLENPTSHPILLLVTFGIILDIYSILEKRLLRARGDDGSMIVVTDIGLSGDQYIRGRSNRTVTQWEKFDGYRVTDDAIALVFSSPFRQKWEFDREEINDETALVDGLGEYLPRLDAEGATETDNVRSTPVGEYS